MSVLMLIRQGLPHERKSFVLRHLAQSEEVGQVSPQEIGYYLSLGHIPYLCHLFPVLLQLHCHLPY